MKSLKYWLLISAISVIIIIISVVLYPLSHTNPNLPGWGIVHGQTPVKDIQNQTLLCLIEIVDCYHPSNLMPIIKNDIQNQTGNATTLYDEAQAKAYEGNYSAAIPLYLAALKINPYDTYPLDGMGRALHTLHNDTSALLYLDKSLSVDPNNIYALQGKGFVLYTLHNYTDALKYYNKILKARNFLIR